MFEEVTDILPICQQYPQRICQCHRVVLRVNCCLNLHVSVVSYSLVHTGGPLHLVGCILVQFIPVFPKWPKDFGSLVQANEAQQNHWRHLCYDALSLHICQEFNEEEDLNVLFGNAGLYSAAAHEAFIWTVARTNLPRSAPWVRVCGRALVITVGAVCVLLAPLTLASLAGEWISTLVHECTVQQVKFSAQSLYICWLDTSICSSALSYVLGTEAFCWHEH